MVHPKDPGRNNTQPGRNRQCCAGVPIIVKNVQTSALHNTKQVLYHCMAQDGTAKPSSSCFQRSSGLFTRPQWLLWQPFTAFYHFSHLTSPIYLSVLCSSVGVQLVFQLCIHSVKAIEICKAWTCLPDNLALSHRCFMSTETYMFHMLMMDAFLLPSSFLIIIGLLSWLDYVMKCVYSVV